METFQEQKAFTMPYGYIFSAAILEIYYDSVYISWNNQIKLVVFLFIINKNVNFECISITKHIINSFNDKLIL